MIRSALPDHVRILIIKVVLAPALIGVASWVSRRWGASAGGWFAALPLTSGPVVLVLAAHGALAPWSGTHPDRRAAVLNDAADYIVEHLEIGALALTREQGKTRIESRAEFGRVVETLGWHASAVRHATEPRRDGDQSGVTNPEPIGVVAAFTPWNYPAVIAARKVGAARLGVRRTRFARFLLVGLLDD